jgi:cyanophycin synthetase
VRIARILALSGPNVWSRKTVLEVWLTGAAEPWDADCSYSDRLLRLDVWWSAACRSAAVPDDKNSLIVEQLQKTSQHLRAFAALALGLQTLAGTTAADSWIERNDSEDTLCVAVEYVEEPVARMAVSMAHRLVWEAPGELPEPTGYIRDLRACAEETCFGPTTRAIVAVARARGIPVSRVDDNSLLQLGQGARQRRIQGAITGRSGFLAELISTDKSLTKRLLRKLHIPTAAGRVVQNAEEAWRVASEIGLPVVVKPRDADYGNGVSLNLTTQEEVAAAWRRAREFRRDVLVEQQLAGFSHRLFVANDVLVAAARREPAQVIGDGRQTVAELIAAANRDPRRGDEPDQPLYPITINEPLMKAVENQGLNLDSVPAAGRPVNLQLDVSDCRAESIVDVTDRVHADVAAAVVDAVRAVGLDVAGVDVMAQDIGRPLEEQGGGILEVNAGPAIYLHRSPQCQPERPVAEAIVGSLFGPGDNGRIPLIAVVGDEAACQVSRAIAHLGDDGSRVVGLSCRDGITIGRRRLTNTPAANANGCRTLLAHPRPELVICELSLDAIRNEGLPFDQCAVAVIAGGSAPGLHSGECRDRSQCLHCLADCLTPGGTLVANVEDPEVTALGPPGRRNLVAVALAGDLPYLVAHRRNGGRAVWFDGSEGVFAEGEKELARQDLADCRPAGSSTAGPEELPALLACAAVWSVAEGAPGHAGSPTARSSVIQPDLAATEALEVFRAARPGRA